MDEANLVDVADKATNVVADAAEKVAEQAGGAAEAVRSLNGIKVAYASLGMTIGATVGALIAYKVAYTRANTKYNEIAEEEIATMRQHYHDKVLALEATAAKPSLEDVMEGQGYTPPSEEGTGAPMAVSPPAAVVEAAKEELLDEQPADATVVKEPELHAETRNIFEEAQVDDHWDYHEERARRSPMEPYVIHADERGELGEEYSTVTYTYYDADDVICNEQDEIMPPEDRDRVLGEQNLNKFGHGSLDPSIVYIRNDSLEMEIEVVKSPNAYAEEVHGFTHGDDRSTVERMRARERQHFDDDE